MQLVRAVARRDSDDRTLSELIKFQDALERLGLLWAPFDCLQKSQSIELVRNLHVRFWVPRISCQASCQSGVKSLFSPQTQLTPPVTDRAEV